MPVQGNRGLYTQTEEAKLLARFGEEYGAYRQRTGRFIPTLRPTNRGS